MKAIITVIGKDKVGILAMIANECAKAIIQSGIKEIIYGDDKYAETEGVIASKRMLDSAGVRYRKYWPSGRKIELDI